MPIEVLGIDRALQNLERVARSVDSKEAKQIFVEAAWLVVKWARYFAPYDTSRVKGVHLRDSILVTPGPLLFSDALVSVRYKRPGAPHAHLVEFGTAKFSGQAFMRPAAATASKEVEALIHRRLSDLIAKAPR